MNTSTSTKVTRTRKAPPTLTERGMRVIETRRILAMPHTPGAFLIPTSADASLYYRVTLTTCTCPAAMRGVMCCHRAAVELLATITRTPRTGTCKACDAPIAGRGSLCPPCYAEMASDLGGM